MTVRRSREVTVRSDTADAPRRVMRGFSYSSHSVGEVACRGWWVGWDGTYVLRGGRCGDSRRVGPLRIPCRDSVRSCLTNVEGESCCHERFLRFPGLGPTTPPSPAGAEE